MDVLKCLLMPLTLRTLKISLLIAAVMIIPSLIGLLLDATGRVRETDSKPRQNRVLSVYPQPDQHKKPGIHRADIQLTSADMIEDLGSKAVNATDPRLLRLICEKWLLAPSNRPYDLKNPKKKHNSQVKQSETVDELLKQRENGFFVEAGAADGELFSNSLFFERFRNWTGLLVEADPWIFESLIKKHRKSYTINACLSPRPHPQRIEFTYASLLGGISETGRALPANVQSVIRGKGLPQCFPIHSILAALGVTHVDYFSLDVEGAEAEILRTFPWGDITVDVWSVEYSVFEKGPKGERELARRLKEIQAIFQKTGMYREVKFPHGLDVLFARREISIT